MRRGTCAIVACRNRKIIGRGLCQTHYHRWWRYGDPLVRVKERTAAERNTPEYRAWKAIKSRCYNPLVNGAKYYSGKGIKVCDHWRTSYFAFLKDMGRRPGPGYSIDRIDPDGNYEPTNCRWADKYKQAPRPKKR